MVVFSNVVNIFWILPSLSLCLCSSLSTSSANLSLCVWHLFTSLSISSLTMLCSCSRFFSKEFTLFESTFVLRHFISRNFLIFGFLFVSYLLVRSFKYPSRLFINLLLIFAMVSNSWSEWSSLKHFCTRRYFTATAVHVNFLWRMFVTIQHSSLCVQVL